jgi:hypothetical protein
MAPDEIKPDEQPGVGAGWDPAVTGEQGEQAERAEAPAERRSLWARISKKVSDWFDRQP